MENNEHKKGGSAVDRDVLCSFLSDTLNCATIIDYSCNGLQVEGTGLVYKVGLAVDACMESFKAAVTAHCQMLIVHHGIIWGGITSVTGRINTLLRYLFENNCSLYAAHLPLDMHLQYGNNAQLARTLNLKELQPFGLYKGISIGFKGILPYEQSLATITGLLNTLLATNCIILPFGNDSIRTVGIVSGGAASSLDDAIHQNLDCFITGEPSHENYHAAKEAGINVIYGGHYHTEKAGVSALGRLIEETFSISTEFLDIPTTI